MNDNPEVLYKYRTWSNEFHKNIIRNGELYLANPNSFEDKYDCNIPLDLDSVTDKEILRRYFELSKIQNPNFSRHQHRQYARDWVKKNLLRDIPRCREIEEHYFNEFDKQVGVLSLTSNSKNPQLWKKYAENQKGFCLGFKFSIIKNNLEVFGSCGSVQYLDKFPSISPFVNESEEEEHKTWITQIFTKLKKWEFEDEYRIFKMRSPELSKKERTIWIPKESIVELIFGPKMEEGHKQEIKDTVNVGYPNLKLLQASN